jgi:hypothetical protein
MNNPLLFHSASLFGFSLLLGCINIGFTSRIQVWYFAFLCLGVFVSLMNHGWNSKAARFLDRCTMIFGIFLNLYIYIHNLQIPNIAIICNFLAIVMYFYSKYINDVTFHMISHGFVYVGNLLIFIHL